MRRAGRRRPRARVAVLLVVGASLLTGCASPEPGGTPASSSPDAEPTAPSPPAAPTSSAPRSATPPSATPPSADPTTPPPPTSGGDLPAELTITLDETGSGVAREITLTCVPTGGDHPDPQAACATLADVGVGAFAPPPKDQMCTEQWGGPQVALVFGTVDGTAVQARFSRTNGCEISRWDAFAPLLGSAGGAI